MKKIVVLLIAIFTLALLQRCYKDTGLSSKENNTQTNVKYEPQELIKLLEENGITATINSELESRSSLSTGCEPNGIYCTSFNITDTIVIPHYCGTHIVRYKVWVCPETTIYFTDFRVDPLVGCDSLTNAWKNSTNDQLAIAFDRYYYAASLVAEYEFINALHLTVNCPNSYAGAEFYMNLCYRWCVKIVSKPGDDDIYFQINRVFCGRSCCKRTIQYCYQNGVLQASNPVFSLIGSGDCGISPVGTCDGKLVGNCYRSCGKP